MFLLSTPFLINVFKFQESKLKLWLSQQNTVTKWYNKKIYVFINLKKTTFYKNISYKKILTTTNRYFKEIHPC